MNIGYIKFSLKYQKAHGLHGCRESNPIPVSHSAIGSFPKEHTWRMKKYFDLCISFHREATSKMLTPFQNTFLSTLTLLATKDNNGVLLVLHKQTYTKLVFKNQ